MEYNVTVVKYTYNNWTQFTVLGWRPLVRELGLNAGDRVMLDPQCRDPWRFRLTVLRTSAAPDQCFAK